MHTEERECLCLPALTLAAFCRLRSLLDFRSLLETFSLKETQRHNTYLLNKPAAPSSLTPIRLLLASLRWEPRPPGTRQSRRAGGEGGCQAGSSAPTLPKAPTAPTSPQGTVTRSESSSLLPVLRVGSSASHSISAGADRTRRRRRRLEARWPAVEVGPCGRDGPHGSKRTGRAGAWKAACTARQPMGKATYRAASPRDAGSRYPGGGASSHPHPPPPPPHTPHRCPAAAPALPAARRRGRRGGSPRAGTRLGPGPARPAGGTQRARAARRRQGAAARAAGGKGARRGGSRSPGGGSGGGGGSGERQRRPVPNGPGWPLGTGSRPRGRHPGRPLSCPRRGRRVTSAGPCPLGLPP